MNRLFRFPDPSRRDPQVEACLEEWRRQGSAHAVAAIAWFTVLRGLGEDIREVLHDGQPTACVGEVAFAYVDVFTSHANLGFFDGAALPDPTGLLEGSGKFMRHVKLRPEAPPEEGDVRRLIEAAYAGMKAAVVRDEGNKGNTG